MRQEEGRVRETHIVDVVKVHLRVKNATPVSLRSLATCTKAGSMSTICKQNINVHIHSPTRCRP